MQPEGKTLQCNHVPLTPGSRRERCGYRILRSHRSSEDRVHCLGRAKKYNEAATRVKEILLSTVSPEQFVLTLLEAEPPHVLVSRPSKPFTEASMMMSLTKLADKELVHMIGWAKKIPGKKFRLVFLFVLGNGFTVSVCFSTLKRQNSTVGTWYESQAFCPVE